jgi:hypothetical protein
MFIAITNKNLLAKNAQQGYMFYLPFVGQPPNY